MPCTDRSARSKPWRTLPHRCSPIRRDLAVIQLPQYPVADLRSFGRVIVVKNNFHILVDKLTTMKTHNTSSSLNVFRYGLRGLLAIGALIAGHTGHCVTLVPSSGSWFVDPGSNTLIQDAGANENYGDGQDGWVEIRNGGSGQYRIVGKYDTESGYDYLGLYDGVGTGGTLLAEYSGQGDFEFTCTPGQVVTIRFRTDGSVTRPGFSLAMLWSTVPQFTIGGFDVGCGGRLELFDPGFTGEYGNNVDNSMHFYNGGNGVIQVTGNYNTEECCDPITIYEGYGSGGAVLAQFAGIGNINFSSSPGQAITIRFLSDFSVVSQGFAVLVQYTGDCGGSTIPASGTSAIACGGNAVLRDAGGAGNYDDSQSGYTVLECSGSAQVKLEGMYDTEQCCDALRIYEGNGLGGALVAEYRGQGVLTPYTGAPGTPITVAFETDGSVVRAGFELNVSYVGQCSLVGIDELVQVPLIAVAPNPTSGQFTILGADLSANSIELVNVTGQRVMQLPYSANVDISTLASGSYILTIFDRDGKGLHRARVVRD